VDAICDAYLLFAGALSPGDRAGPLAVIGDSAGSEAPAGLPEVVEVLSTADYGSMDVRPQMEILIDFVFSLCEQRYYRDVVGAADDIVAAEEFFAALVAGDRDRAAAVAPDHVLAGFEPWEGYPSQDDIPSLVVAEAIFYLQLTPELSLACEASDGIVFRCRR
jgi:hypothetical protein